MLDRVLRTLAGMDSRGCAAGAFETGVRARAATSTIGMRRSPILTGSLPDSGLAVGGLNQKADVSCTAPRRGGPAKNLPPAPDLTYRRSVRFSAATPTVRRGPTSSHEADASTRV